MHHLFLVVKPGTVGAANDFEAPERLRKLVFSKTVLAPKIPEQMPLGLLDASDEEDA